MLITLEEMKNYLRVDFDDDDALIETLITAATWISFAQRILTSFLLVKMPRLPFFIPLHTCTSTERKQTIMH